MFLTPQAKALLLSNNKTELQQLAIELLIANHQEIFNDLPMADQISANTSAPAALRDNILFATLEDPVAVSSGHIYSRETVKRLMENREPRCPNTQERLNRDIVTSLPQITYAIATWKLENVVQENKLASNSLMLSKIEIGNNKVRLYFAGNEKPLFAFLNFIFKNKNNNISEMTSYSYHATSWSFAWSVTNNRVQLEMWFPKKALKDEHINQIIDATLKPLALPVEITTASDSNYSISNLRSRCYVTTVNNIHLDYSKAANCLIEFLKITTHLRQEFGNITDDFKDEIIPGNHAPTHSRKVLGQGIFSSTSNTPRTSAASSSSSAISGSQASSSQRR